MCRAFMPSCVTRAPPTRPYRAYDFFSPACHPPGPHPPAQHFSRARLHLKGWQPHCQRQWPINDRQERERRARRCARSRSGQRHRVRDQASLRAQWNCQLISLKLLCLSPWGAFALPIVEIELRCNLAVRMNLCKFVRPRCVLLRNITL